MKTEFNMQIAVKNIIAMRRKAKPEDVAHGVAWYAEAYEQCRIIADRFNLPIHIVTGVVAALSPNNRWELNIRNANDLICAFTTGSTMDDVSVCTYSTMKQKAWSILEQMPDRYEENDTLIVDEVKTILNGKKIICFYENIMGDDTCTIDGHARNIVYKERISLHDSKLTIGVKEYRNLTGCYIAATKRINKENSTSYLPYQIQAITWCAWRRLHGIK